MLKHGTIKIEVVGDGFAFWEKYMAIKRSTDSNCSAAAKELELTITVTATAPKDKRERPE